MQLKLNKENNEFFILNYIKREMSSDIIIHNPLCFMNEQYIKKKVLVSKYENGIPVIITQDEYPVKIIITFPSVNIAQEFINEYKDSVFEPSFE